MNCLCERTSKQAKGNKKLYLCNLNSIIDQFIRNNLFGAQVWYLSPDYVFLLNYFNDLFFHLFVWRGSFFSLSLEFRCYFPLSLYLPSCSLWMAVCASEFCCIICLSPSFIVIPIFSIAFGREMRVYVLCARSLSSLKFI